MHADPAPRTHSLCRQYDDCRTSRTKPRRVPAVGIPEALHLVFLGARGQRSLGALMVPVELLRPSLRRQPPGPLLAPGLGLGGGLEGALLEPRCVRLLLEPARFLERLLALFERPRVLFGLLVPLRRRGTLPPSGRLGRARLALQGQGRRGLPRFRALRGLPGALRSRFCLARGRTSPPLGRSQLERLPR